MKIKVKIHPNSSQEKIEKRGEKYEIWLKEKPIDNKANEKLLKLLKKYFKTEVSIKASFNSRNKIIDIK